MKKLFLASSGLSALKQFVGADPNGMSMLFIPTAGNLDDGTWWIEKDREVLTAMGFNLYELDIESAERSDMNEQLMTSDIVYIAGGNTFYLLKQLRKSGFDTLLSDYVTNGGLYAGASAGALVVGTDIGPIAPVDEPDKVYGLKSTKGLKFVNLIPVPHYDMGNRTSKIDSIKADYDGESEMVLMTDDQAIIVEGDQWKLVDSPRSALELDWYRKAKIV